MAGKFDLGSLLSSISDAVTQADGDKDQAALILGQNQQLREASVQSTQKAADLSTEVAQIDMQQQLEMQNRRKAAAATFGTDILNPENRVAYLAREQAAAVDEAISQSKRASELNQTNFFEDPLSYMVERPFASRHTASATEAANRVKITSQAIQDLNQQTQSTIETQKAITTEITQDEIAKRAALARLKADEIVRDARINANDKFLTDLKTLREMDSQSLKWATEGYKLKRQEEEFQMRMAEARAAREERSKQKKSKEEELAYQMMRYNLGAETLNLSKAQSTGDFLAIQKLNEKHTAEVISIGERTWIEPSMDGKQVTRVSQIAATPGQSFTTLQYFRGNLPDSAAKMKDLYATAMQQALNASKGTKITPDQLSAQVNEILLGKQDVDKKGKIVSKAGLLEQMRADMETPAGRLENIFRAPSADTIRTAFPELEKMPEWKQIVEPASAAKGDKITADSLMTQAKMAVMERKVSPQQAANMIASYFRAANLLNSSTENYRLVGIEPPKAYNASVTSGKKTFFNGNVYETIDMTDENRIVHTIVQNLPLGQIRTPQEKAK